MTILMGVIGRFPIGIATGLGLNALLAFAIAPRMTWPQAMGLIVLEGVIIALLVLTGFRTAVFRAVPRSLRVGISVGIGLFITFVGLFDGGIVRKPAGAPPVELGINGSLIGWPMLVFVFGLFTIAILYAKRVKGAILISIVAATVVAVIFELIANVGAKSADNPSGWALNVPQVHRHRCAARPETHRRRGRLRRLRILSHRGLPGQRLPAAAVVDLLAAAGRLLRHHGHRRCRRCRGELARRAWASAEPWADPDGGLTGGGGRRRRVRVVEHLLHRVRCGGG